MSPELAAKVLEKIPDDEPIFILRAGDVLTKPTISYWIIVAAGRGVSHDKLEAADAHWKSIDKWQETHPVKIPD